MRFFRVGLIALTIAAVASPAFAQYERPRKGERNAPAGPPQIQQAPQGGACVPSGFARLSRNCNTNTGGCQRMPETCSRGWCCP